MMLLAAVMAAMSVASAAPAMADEVVLFGDDDSVFVLFDQDSDSDDVEISGDSNDGRSINTSDVQNSQGFVKVG